MNVAQLMRELQMFDKEAEVNIEYSTYDGAFNNVDKVGVDQIYIDPDNNKDVSIRGYADDRKEGDQSK